MANALANPKHDIHFTIDGEAFETQEKRQLASALLILAGVDPADYDLGEIVDDHAKPKHYADNDEVTIHPGSRFVTLRVGPAPVE